MSEPTLLEMKTLLVQNLDEIMSEHADDAHPHYNECDDYRCQWCEDAQRLKDYFAALPAMSFAEDLQSDLDYIGLTL